MLSRSIAGGLSVNPKDQYTADFQRGIALREAGELNESKLVLERVVTGRMLSLGAQHDETMAAKSQLGRTLREFGDRERARILHEECLAFRRRVFGSQHEWTKNSMRILADTLDSVGRSEEARKLREEAGPEPDARSVAPLTSQAAKPFTFSITTKSGLQDTATRDLLGDLYSRKDQGKDNGMLSS